MFGNFSNDRMYIIFFAQLVVSSCVGRKEKKHQEFSLNVGLLTWNKRCTIYKVEILKTDWTLLTPPSLSAVSEEREEEDLEALKTNLGCWLYELGVFLWWRALHSDLYCFQIGSETPDLHMVYDRNIIASYNTICTRTYIYILYIHIQQYVQSINLCVYDNGMHHQDTLLPSFEKIKVDSKKDMT